MDKYFRIYYTDKTNSVITKYASVATSELTVLKSSKPMKTCVESEVVVHEEDVVSVELFRLKLDLGTFGTDITHMGVLCAHKDTGLVTVIALSKDKDMSLRLVSIYFLIDLLDNGTLVYSLVRLISNTSHYKEYQELKLWQENQRFMGAEEHSNIKVCAPLIKDGVLLWVMKSQAMDGDMLLLDLAGVRLFAQGSLVFSTDSKSKRKSSDLLCILREDLEAVTLPIISSYERLKVWLMPKGAKLNTIKSINSNVGYIDKDRIYTRYVLTRGFHGCVGGLFLELPFTQQLFNVAIKQLYIMDSEDSYVIADKLINPTSKECVYNVNYTESDIELVKSSGEEYRFSLPVSSLLDWVEQGNKPADTDKPLCTSIKGFGDATLLDILRVQESESSNEADKALEELVGLLYWLHRNDIRLVLGGYTDEFTDKITGGVEDGEEPYQRACIGSQ